jgi:hypothetical protein
MRDDEKMTEIKTTLRLERPEQGQNATSEIKRDLTSRSILAQVNAMKED